LRRVMRDVLNNGTGDRLDETWRGGKFEGAPSQV
jgi:hypothetical protein